MTSTRDPTAVEKRTWPFAPFRFFRAHYRLALCGVIGVALGALSPDTIDQIAIPLEWLQPLSRNVTRILIGWNAAISIYLGWATFRLAHSTHEDIRLHAKDADEGRGLVLAISAVSAFMAIGAIVLELGQVKSVYESEKATHILLAIFTVLVSWTFMHLIFAFHYAHEYYFEMETATERKRVLRGGLDFPGERSPQYWDFLYYAFVIGVACQTADVTTTSATMRYMTLIHGALAFFYNATILALAVNIASDIV